MVRVGGSTRPGPQHDPASVIWLLMLIFATGPTQPSIDRSITVWVSSSGSALRMRDDSTPTTRDATFSAGRTSAAGNAS